MGARRSRRNGLPPKPRPATLRRAGLGWNPHDRHEAPAAWGLPTAHEPLWLPAGLVIPWIDDGQVVRLNVRRLNPGHGPKYQGPAGWTAHLYGADAVTAALPAILVEGQFDALAIAQYAGDLAAPVATGSATGARTREALRRLCAPAQLFLAFDADAAGEKAAAWWRDRLPHATRLRPWRHDPAAMGCLLRPWLTAALAGQPLPDDHAQDLVHAWQERAAILLSDADLAPEEAERQALAQVFGETFPD